MLTLAIDTSGSIGSIALCNGDDCLTQRTLELGTHHGQSLLPEIRTLLASSRLTPRNIELIAVSTGPGSFTGLRVGIVCAKTLAYAVGCPLAGIETLTTIAYNAPDDVREVHVFCDAQRGDVFVQRFLSDNVGHWTPSAPIEIVSAATWAAQLPMDAVVTGPDAERFADLLKDRCRLLPDEARRPHPAIIARLGQRALSAGTCADPWTLEPLYLRRSSAEDKWDARHR